MVQWAKEHREARQAKNTHQSFTLGFEGSGRMPGAGGITIHSSDLDSGSRDLDVSIRPVILGLVEWRVKLSTQSVASGKPHAKSAYLYTTPAAARELAALLLETADEAEKARPKPRPVK